VKIKVSFTITSAGVFCKAYERGVQSVHRTGVRRAKMEPVNL